MGILWVILYVVVSGTLGDYMSMSLCPYLLGLFKYPPEVRPEVRPETVYLRLTIGHPVSHYYKAIGRPLSNHPTN
ncbi:hypothetical protein 71Y_53 [Klebsiella phage vB_KpnP_71Y]